LSVLKTQGVQLGLGLIGIGKRWGHAAGDVPPEKDALSLLEFAVELGVRYLDCAPSYGVSEQRLGKFLGSLAAEQRSQLTIATKFGEHWDFSREAPYVDHSFAALQRSLDGSLERLGRIDILQLHKTTPAVLRSDDLRKAWEYAASLGIEVVGASVSDLESAAIAVDTPGFGCIQLPLNLERREFAPVVERAAARGMWVATNRPYAMGAMLYAAKPLSKTAAFDYILSQRFHGAILTGTTNKTHLRENWDAFERAAASYRGTIGT
jgi:aryl-alcohol dehydrogenase-like predicted oxidoreductase